MACLEDDTTTGEGTSVLEARTSRKPKPSKKKRKKKPRVKPSWELEAPNSEAGDAKQSEPEPEIEYVAAEILPDDDPAYAEFKDIFSCFKTPEELTNPEKEEEKEEEDQEEKDGEESGNESDEGEKLSKKKRKLMKRLNVAELKRLVSNPEVVEMHDTTAADPRLLVYLKAYRNTVPVPRHWLMKRKYLQGKRGIEKVVFELPDFIKATGIQKIREAYMEKEAEKRAKQKNRERTAPKMHKMDIDYQVLHDAFFKFQTKPRLTSHGDMYYEGKEFEVKLKEKRPGNLSDDLKTALGMPTNDDKVPVPWLINMQRYGPPPSYPNLRIPGVNAPIPNGASYGYHLGGWGKPPVDEYGRPLYGDPFGTAAASQAPQEPIEKTLWGQIEEEEEEEEESDSESEEEMEEEDAENKSQAQGEDVEGGIASVASSVMSGVETPDMIDLRKTTRTLDNSEAPKQLFQVLEEQASSVGGALMGSSHTYAVPGNGKERKRKSRFDQGVSVALNPEELENLDNDALNEKFNQVKEAEAPNREDFSDMVAEEAARKEKKRKAKEKEARAKKMKNMF